MPIRTSYGLCQDCYDEVQRDTQQDYYPKVWTVAQAAGLDAASKGKIWRRTRKILRYSFGMTTLAEWLQLKPIDLYVNEADDRLLVASIRILGYLGYVTSRRRVDELTAYPLSVERIHALVEQAFSSG